jgi:hypothetical protein
MWPNWVKYCKTNTESPSYGKITNYSIFSPIQIKKKLSKFIDELKNTKKILQTENFYPITNKKDQFITTYLRKFALDEQEPSDEEKQELLDEVDCLTLASHLFWGLWGIVNVHQDIEFGYWVSDFFLLTKKTTKFDYFVPRKN